MSSSPKHNDRLWSSFTAVTHAQSFLGFPLANSALTDFPFQQVKIEIQGVQQ